MRKRAVWGSFIALFEMMSLLIGGCGRILTPMPPTPTPTSSTVATATPTLVPDAYLTPLPPTPTFTPTPTPTPVIHVVESGDTLFGIALEYGVSPEAIQRANGLDNPQYLRIGQALIIPIGTDGDDEPGADYAPADALILPTPTPLPLEAAHLALRPTPLGDLWCIGEVVNTQTEPVTNIQLELLLVGADGKPLLSQRTLAAADRLPPGRAAPFAVLFPAPPEGVESCQVRLLRAETISEITAALRPLEVVEAYGEPAGPQYRVYGTLIHHNGVTVGHIHVVATLYAEDGTVLTYREAAFPDDYLLPDDVQLPFELYLTLPAGQEPLSFSILAWGTAQP